MNDPDDKYLIDLNKPASPVPSFVQYCLACMEMNLNEALKRARGDFPADIPIRVPGSF